MKRPAALPLVIAALTAAAAATPPDLLRLTNGELEGRFGGIDRDGVLRWERDDGIAPLEFRTTKVRQIILRGASSERVVATTSHVELVNGDRIPASITALDGDNLSLESETAGPLVIPRDAVRSLAPNPFGGRLVYAGPFDPTAWNLDDGNDPEPENEGNDGEDSGPDAEAPDPGEDPPPAEDPQEDAPEDAGESAEAEDEAGWRHIGSRWYHVAGNDAITLDTDMPDRSIFRFRLDWRGRSTISVGFHADFAPPPPPPADDDEDEGAEPARRRVQAVVSGTRGLVNYFGNSLVMTLRGNYVNLYQCGYDPDGQPFINSLRSSNRTLQIGEIGQADFEFRTDLAKGFISLFVNGEFSMQWQTDDFDAEADKGGWQPGGGVGFRVEGDENPLRISDVIIAEWHGMPDSARSLEHDDWDVVLLTNGTDRVSGRVQSIADGRLTLEGRYAPLTIPVTEVAEIRFAGSALREPEPPSGDRVRIHFQPLGLVSGVPGVTRDGVMALKSALLGDLSISLESAAIIEFRQGGNFLDVWDEDF